MTITFTTEELSRFENKFHSWFYACINEVVPKMLTSSFDNPSTDKDYRDHCARLMKEYTKEHPMPTWKRDL